MLNPNKLGVNADSDGFLEDLDAPAPSAAAAEVAT
jgi:hypothetical protein